MTKLFINGKSRNIYKNNDGSYYYKQGGQNIDASQFFKKGGELKAKYKHLGGNNDENNSLTLTLPNFPLNKSTNSRKKITGGFSASGDTSGKVIVTFDNLLGLINNINLTQKIKPDGTLTSEKAVDTDTTITDILNHIEKVTIAASPSGVASSTSPSESPPTAKDTMKKIKKNIAFLKAIVNFGNECKYFSETDNKVEHLESYHTQYASKIDVPEIKSLGEIVITKDSTSDGTITFKRFNDCVNIINKLTKT